MVEDHETVATEDRLSEPQKSPLISVISVSFNAVGTIEDTLRSVANSTYSNVEHIVIDGGSTDGTLELIKAHEAELAKWISEPDKGIFHAMNKGLDLATGDLVTFLNADDQHPEDALDIVARISMKNRADIYYGEMLKSRDMNGEEKRMRVRPDLSLMPRTMGLFHPATFMSRSVFDKIGRFDERYQFSADYDLLLRAYLAGVHFHYITEPLAIFRVGGKSGMDHRSYVEGYRILKAHDTGHQKAMRKLILKAWVKEKLYKLTNGGELFGKRRVERRIQSKWAPSE